VELTELSQSVKVFHERWGRLARFSLFDILSVHSEMEPAPLTIIQFLL
jgi:hypothetical protein